MTVLLSRVFGHSKHLEVYLLNHRINRASSSTGFHRRSRHNWSSAIIRLTAVLRELPLRRPVTVRSHTQHHLPPSSSRVIDGISKTSVRINIQVNSRTSSASWVKFNLGTSVASSVSSITGALSASGGISKYRIASSSGASSPATFRSNKQNH